MKNRGFISKSVSSSEKQSVPLLGEISLYQVNRLNDFQKKPTRFIFHIIVLRMLFRNLYCSVQFSRSVLSDSLRPHEPQHARPPCPSHLPEFTQTHVHRVGDAIQPSHPLSSPSPPNYNEISPHTSQNGHHQKVYKQQMLERMCRKRNSPTLLVEMYTDTVTMEEQYGGSLKG